MAISKVILNNDVQIDITDTTATQGQVASTAYYYGADGVKKQGSYVVPSAVTQATPTISVNSSTGLITASATQSAGVVSAGTKSATEQLSTQAAQTLYPSTTDQTISSGKYLTGTQTFKGVLLTNLSAGNIKKDVVVKVGDSADDDRITSVTGTYEGGGVTPAEQKDVNFIDYDGIILYSYTKAEFAQLAALPANPSHTGLTAQGWNWSLSDAKTYVASYGKLWIGQMYTTSDGKTRLYIHLESPRLSPYLGVAVNGTATVEWGDGSSDSTITGTSTDTVIDTQHNYAAAGDYVIAISVSGSMAFVGDSSYGSQVLWKNSTTAYLNRVYQNAIQKVEIGANASIGTYAFDACYSLASITVPSGVTSFGNYAFRWCYSLASITIPSGVTSFGSYAFQYCYSLANITIPSGVTSIRNYAFRWCYSLANITIPSGVTSIGTYAFQYCYSLASTSIPSEVTTISTYAFSECYGLGEIHFKPTTPPTVANANAFNSLPTDCIIYVPYSADHSVVATYTSANNYPSSSTYTYMEE